MVLNDLRCLPEVEQNLQSLDFWLISSSGSSSLEVSGCWVANKSWFGGCIPGLDSHPGALSASFLTLSKSSSDPGDFQVEDGEQSSALSVLKKTPKHPKSFLGVRSFPSITAQLELVLRR